MQYTYDPSGTPPKLQAGDTLVLPYHGPDDPLKVKIPICYDNITITGTTGPNGEPTCLDANGAKQLPYDGFRWPVEGNGLITVCKAGDPPVRNISIKNVSLCNARARMGYVTADGQAQPYITATAGVALYGADKVTIENCEVYHCGNGIFGKSVQGGLDDLLGYVLIKDCYIHDNNEFLLGHQHNLYIECIHLVMDGNKIIHPFTGTGVKTRCAVAELWHNYIDGGSYCWDANEPDDGGQLLRDQDGGMPHVGVGNIFVNRAVEAVAFFPDQGTSVGVTRMLLSWNTIISLSSRNIHYNTMPIKLAVGARMDLINNILYAESPDYNLVGDYWLYASDMSACVLAVDRNWFPDFGHQVDDTGSTNVQLFQGNPLIIGPDPKLADILNGDFRPWPSSPVRGQALPAHDLWPAWPPAPTRHGVGGKCVARLTANDMGAVES